MNWTIAAFAAGAMLAFCAGLFLFRWTLDRIADQFGFAWAMAFAAVVVSAFFGFVAGVTAR